MSNRRYWLWLAVLTGFLLIGPQAVAAPLPSGERDGGETDKPTDGPGTDGDADDLMVYFQPTQPGVEVVQGDGDDPEVSSGGHEYSKREWIREFVVRWLSWLLPRGMLRL